MQVRRKTHKKHSHRKGGACACSGAGAQSFKLPLSETFKAIGGACACAAGAMGSATKSIYNLMPRLGGSRHKAKYHATKKDKKYLKLWKQGKSIGFTMRSSLKAKGLIPRVNGTRRVSNKYK